MWTLLPVIKRNGSESGFKLKSPLKIIGIECCPLCAMRCNSASSTWIWAKRTSVRFGLNSKCVVATTNWILGFDWSANRATMATLQRFNIWKWKIVPQVSVSQFNGLRKKSTHMYAWLKIVHRMAFNQLELIGIEENCTAIDLISASFFVQCFIEIQCAQLITNFRQIVLFHLLQAQNVRCNLCDFTWNATQSMWPIQGSRIMIGIERFMRLKMRLWQYVVRHDRKRCGRFRCDDRFGRRPFSRSIRIDLRCETISMNFTDNLWWEEMTKCLCLTQQAHQPSRNNLWHNCDNIRIHWRQWLIFYIVTIYYNIIINKNRIYWNSSWLLHTSVYLFVYFKKKKKCEQNVRWQFALTFASRTPAACHCQWRSSNSKQKPEQQQNRKISGFWTYPNVALFRCRQEKRAVNISQLIQVVLYSILCDISTI